MILSGEMYLRIRDIVQDKCLSLDAYSDDPLVMAFETGKAAGMAELAKEIYFDLFGEDTYDDIEE